MQNAHKEQLKLIGHSVICKKIMLNDEFLNKLNKINSFLNLQCYKFSDKISYWEILAVIWCTDNQSLSSL